MVARLLKAFVLALFVRCSRGACRRRSNDAQIAHIAYTAGQIDIAAAKLALEKSKNAEVRAFAQNMVDDHTAVNQKALALLKKLNVTPEDNATSQGLAKQAEAKRAELKAPQRRSLRQGLCRQRGRLSPDGQRRAARYAHSRRAECRAEGAAANRAQDLRRSSAACRTSRHDAEVRARPCGRCDLP